MNIRFSPSLSLEATACATQKARVWMKTAERRIPEIGLVMQQAKVEKMDLNDVDRIWKANR